jgi:hypothetical protein
MSYIGNEPIVSATRTVTEVTATAGQTVFNANGGYTVGYLDVFLNGAQLQNTDFTATNGSSVTLTEAAQVNDVVRLVAWGTFQSANAVAKTGDTMSGNLSINAQNNKISAINNHLILHDANQSDIPQNWWYIYRSGGDSSLKFYRNGADRMWIDGSGRVLMPYQPCFHVYRNAGNVSATSIVVFESVVTNNGGHYNSSNGRFTAPVAGYYRFTASLLRNSGSILQYRIFKNSTMVAETEDSNTANYSQVAQAAIVQLGVGDYVEIQVRGGVAYGSSSYSTFQGELIG